MVAHDFAYSLGAVSGEVRRFAAEGLGSKFRVSGLVACSAVLPGQAFPGFVEGAYMLKLLALGVELEHKLPGRLGRSRNVLPPQQIAPLAHVSVPAHKNPFRFLDLRGQPTPHGNEPREIGDDEHRKGGHTR